MAHPLERLFRPRSIAVIGGGAWCQSVVEKNRERGYAGDLWPVHPTRTEVGGLPAFRRLEDLPSAPDAAFVGINRGATVEAVGVLAAMGAGGAVCFASGFRESVNETGDGDSLQDRLIAAAGDMPIVGPNCYGFINYLDNAALWPDFHGGRRVDRGVAIVTQSSNIAINLTMQRRGLPIAYMATAGNQAQMGLADIGAALLADNRVTALGLHIEGLNEIRAFEALAATARALGKPVVALKVGLSDQARTAAVSHTASLAGSDAGARALLERLGIGRVETLSEMLEALKILHVAGPLASDRVASISCSGGEASLMADLGHRRALHYPTLNDRQRTDLRAVLGSRVALANPLDYHTYIWGDEAAIAACFTAMMDPAHAIGCVVLDFPRAEFGHAEDWEKVIQAVATTRAGRNVPMAIVASLPETLPEDIAIRLIDLGIVPLNGMAEALAAIECAADLGRSRPVADPVLPPARTSERGPVLTEAEAKAALAAHGATIPASRQADGPDAAARAAAEIGFPVVLKGAGIAHKTEAGAVALDLRDAEAVRVAAAAMPTERFLVEEMVTEGMAELLVGVTRDPAHGYLMTLAAGGVLTELLADRVSLLLPTTPGEIDAALARLSIDTVLRGYRGKPAADRNSIVAAALALQSYAVAEAGRLIEAEINPLICGPERAVAADALIRLADTVGDTDDR